MNFKQIQLSCKRDILERFKRQPSLTPNPSIFSSKKFHGMKQNHSAIKNMPT